MAKAHYTKIKETLSTLKTVLPPEYYVVAGYFYGKNDTGLGIALSMLEDLFKRGEDSDSLSVTAFVESLLRSNIKDAYNVLSTLQKFPKQPDVARQPILKCKNLTDPRREPTLECLSCSDVIQNSEEAWLGCHRMHIHCLVDSLESQMQACVERLHCPIDERPLLVEDLGNYGFSNTFRRRVVDYIHAGISPTFSSSRTTEVTQGGYFECSCCKDQIAYDIIDLDCHRFHHDCIQPLLEDQIKQQNPRLNCPDCGKYVDERMLKHILPLQTIELYERQMVACADGGRGKMEACPLCKAEVWAEEEILEFDCPECGESSCYRCKTKMHIGQTCEEFQSKINKCPHCFLPMSQKIHTSRLICSCGYSCCKDCRKPCCLCLVHK